ncbi:MAG: hypothetical protein K2N27_04850 [Ruminococcus sp.]|nr:hypothetical protein [Ruminococcus sp.]
MKNKQSGVLNNRGWYNQKYLCRIHKRVIAMISSLTMLFTTSTILSYSNFNLVGEITASAEESEQTFTVDGNMDFSNEASKGNWKEDATLEKDGYKWNSETKTLTLGNIYIKGDLILPHDVELNTIVIAEGTNPIVSRYIECSTSMTVKGKGTLTAKFSITDNSSKYVLTITDGTEVITNYMQCSAYNGILIVNNGKLNASEAIYTTKITMDDTAVLEIDINVLICFSTSIEYGLAGFKDYIPLGYKLEEADYNTVCVIPKDTSFVLNEDGLCDVQDKDGNLVTGKVLIKYSEYPDGIGEHLAGHSISLDGNIGVNFYMELDKSVVKDENAYMQFTLPNNKESIVYIKDTKTDTIDGKEYRIFSCNVAPKEITDIITAQIITSDGRKGKVYEYSVKEYADYISDHSGDYDKKTISLVNIMKDYGEYAKSYFSNSETTDISEVTANNLTGFEKQTNGNLPKGIDYYGSSLLLESNTTVRHYFKIAEGTDISKYNFKTKGGYYYTDITGIPAGMLGTPQEKKIGDWSISYSPMSYVYSVLKSDSENQNLVNLCKALYLYQQAAEAYQNNGGK